MGGKKREDVDEEEDFPRVTDAEITEDGAILVKFDRYPVKGKKKVLFMPEALFAVAEEYAEIETEGDFAGYPAVYEEYVFPEIEEEVQLHPDVQDEVEVESEGEPPSVLDAPQENNEEDKDEEN